MEEEEEHLENLRGNRVMHCREESVKFDGGSPGRQSKCWAQEHRERLPRKFEQYRERLTRECAELCEGLPRLVGQIDEKSQKNSIVVTDAMTRVAFNETCTVINAVEHESSFPEFGKGARPVEQAVPQNRNKLRRS